MVEQSSAPALETAPVPAGRRGLWAWMLGALVLVLFRYVLISDVPIYALPWAGHDDGLFVELGASISRGRWLGPYDSLTLAKGPGYPIFIAACRVIHLPLSLGQQLLYVVFCGTFVWAIQPWIRHRLLGLAIFALLLFNPVSFNSGEMARAVREGIYPALSGLALTGALGLAIRGGGPIRPQWVWACGLGFWLGFFWITREEGIWLMPAVALLFGWTVIAACRVSGERLRRLGVLAASVAIFLAIVNAVCLINWYHYGEYTTVEFRSRPFLDAYGALTRIDAGPKPQYVPVPRASRELAYAASPSFARLRGYLEGPPGKMWYGARVKGGQILDDIAGGAFVWALRSAANYSEHFTSADEAMRFYQTMAEEINAACDAGEIPAGPRRSGMTPPWDSRYAGQASRSWLAGFNRVMEFGQWRPGVARSSGSAQGMRLFRKTTLSPLSPAVPATQRARSRGDVASEGFRATGRSCVAWVYQRGLRIAIAISLIVLLLLLPLLWREKPLVLIAAAAIVVSFALRLAILAWIDTTSFAGMGILYLSPLHVMALAFVALGIVAATSPRRAHSRSA